MALTAKRIKQSLGTLLPTTRKLHTLPAEDLLRLVNDKDKTCTLKHKCSGTLSLRRVWKSRLVILANSALYVYEDVTSERPKACISLLGYNCVHRVLPDKSSCQWAFAIACEGDPTRVEMFDCASDQERREWMKKVKDGLCKANNVPPRKLSLVEQLASDLKEEIDYYKLLEEPVFQVEGTRKNHTFNVVSPNARRLSDEVFMDDNDDDESDDEYNGHHGLGRRGGNHVDDDDDEVESYEVGIWCRLQRKGAVKRRRKEGVSSLTTVENEVDGNCFTR